MSSGDKNGNNSSRMTKGCPDDESEDEDLSTTDVSNRVNVQKILESMTNAFNNTVKQKNDNKKKLNNNDNNDNKLIKTDINENKKILENNINSTLNNIDTCENKKSNFDNNDDKEKKNELLTNDNDLIDKQDTSKKDGNPPRIVLTFRTINETTDDGKKTKISSCGSNLSLVPDELVNCDNIGGVSVKIEHSNEQSDQINKEKDNEIVKNSKEVKSSKKLQNQDNNDDVNKTIVGDDNADDNNDDNTINNNDNNDNDDKIKKTNQVTVDDSDVKNNSDKIDENNKTNNATNNVDVPVSRKRKYACKSRALVESAPLPKRSTRRLSKDSFSVLESAMAIKEKSYYTEERKRTYTKPSKNKKLQKDIKETNKKKTTISDTSFTDNNNTSLDDSKNQNSSDDDNKKLNGDFDDMPKLTPMIRQYSNTKKKNDSINNDADIDKPFLRPSASNKPRRERYRGKFISKKAGKLDSVENTTSSKLKLPTTTTSTSAAATEADEKKNDYPEESHVTTKRTRRSMMQSPSPAEGQASKPESTALTTENYLQNLMCLCQIQSQLYCEAKGTDAPLYCTAVDSIDGRLIGCCNAVDDEDVTMRRPSTRVPFIILCRTHKERLLRHNCCPSCGLFCTQGKFIQCINGHQYHINCDILYNKKSVCPHCGTDNPKSIISITMSSTRKPVYIPTRKQFTKITSAKMSLPGNGDNTMLAERPPSLSIIEPDYIKIPDVTLNKDKPERFTISSLYTAVKENDLNKLVNILASGYNSNHIYRDNLNRTVLHLASQYGYLGCVNILVQSGAQLDVMDKNQLTPLMLASENNHIDVVRYLIRAGCDVRIKGKYGMTALHLAAKTGSIDACKIIITECKIPKTLVDTVDDGGWTSLIWASEFRHDNIVRYLIDKKCDPLIRDTEQNIALHWSAYGGCSKITEILLNEGCDVNAVNACGDTPLHIAARQNRYAVTVLLLARGAKINETNNNGQTPIDCCETDGDTIDALRLNANINKSNDNLLEKTFKILTNDISRGKEKNPIQCINGIDNEDKPVDFIYITENCLTTNIFIDRTITSLQSCHCEDNCNSDKCLCGNISLKCWYDKVGKLIPEFNYTDPPMLFECNPACDCNKITCNNRVVQHGITQRFELFRTHKKGWGIKTLRFIPKGTYVCEYVGEILSDSEADNREDDSYLFDLDNRDGETFCIDARRYGNVARFINHSCAPNLLPVRIFVEHQDLRFPRIAFFANRDIDADEELGFDYGEKFWIIKSKSFNCTCGAINCHYSDKTKSLTCNNYKTRISQEEKSTSAKS